MRWTLWWFVLFAVYVITANAEVGTEFIAGAAIAAIAAGLVAFVLRNGKPDVQVRPVWLRRYAPIPMRMARDALIVSWSIVDAVVHGRELTGFFTRVPFRPARRDDPYDIGREALSVYGVSAAPNTIVAEVDTRGELVVHQLVAAPIQAASAEWPL